MPKNKPKNKKSELAAFLMDDDLQQKAISYIAANPEETGIKLPKDVIEPIDFKMKAISDNEIEIELDRYPNENVKLIIALDDLQQYAKKQSEIQTTLKNAIAQEAQYLRSLASSTSEPIHTRKEEGALGKRLEENIPASTPSATAATEPVKTTQFAKSSGGRWFVEQARQLNDNERDEKARLFMLSNQFAGKPVGLEGGFIQNISNKDEKSKQIHYKTSHNQDKSFVISNEQFNQFVAQQLIEEKKLQTKMTQAQTQTKNVESNAKERSVLAKPYGEMKNNTIEKSNFIAAFQKNQNNNDLIQATLKSQNNADLQAFKESMSRYKHTPEAADWAAKQITLVDDFIKNRNQKAAADLNTGSEKERALRIATNATDVISLDDQQRSKLSKELGVPIHSSQTIRIDVVTKVDPNTNTSSLAYQITTKGFHTTENSQQVFDVPKDKAKVIESLAVENLVNKDARENRRALQTNLAENAEKEHIQQTSVEASASTQTITSPGSKR